MPKKETPLKATEQESSQGEGGVQQRLYKHARQRETSKWWVIFDYLFLIPVFFVTVLLTIGLQRLVQNFVLEDGVLVLAIAVTASLWGWVEALVLALLGLVFLDYLIIMPHGHWSVINWPDMLQLLPFCLAGLTIGLLSHMRDKGWLAARQQARQLAEVNQKLENEIQLKNRFLSLTSHELKTPLTSIRMQSQLLQRHLKRLPRTNENEPTLQALARIDERTSVLTNMIDELLDLSRTQQQERTWKREVVDLNTLCQEVVEDQRLATGRSIQLQTASTPATVWGDAQRLSQMVSNLVTNACKYSPDVSLIEVIVEHQERQIFVRVRDHGQGIDQDQLAYIFEPFYRTPEAQSSATGGLGLGLAITKQIVDFHEGRIWCESQKGCGTTFIVQLPFMTNPPLSSREQR